MTNEEPIRRLIDAARARLIRQGVPDAEIRRWEAQEEMARAAEEVARFILPGKPRAVQDSLARWLWRQWKIRYLNDCEAWKDWYIATYGSIDSVTRR